MGVSPHHPPPLPMCDWTAMPKTQTNCIFAISSWSHWPSETCTNSKKRGFGTTPFKGTVFFKEKISFLGPIEFQESIHSGFVQFFKYFHQKMNIFRETIQGCPRESEHPLQMVLAAQDVRNNKTINNKKFAPDSGLTYNSMCPFCAARHCAKRRPKRN